jgi:hypothetical protein
LRLSINSTFLAKKILLSERFGLIFASLYQSAGFRISYSKSTFSTVSLPMSRFFLFFFTLCVALFCANEALSQKWVNDPYKKPDLWAKLKKNPHDSLTWVEYVGQPWAKLTSKQQQTVKLWMQSLWLANVSEKPPKEISILQPAEPPKKEDPKKNFDEYKDLLKQPAVMSFMRDLEETLLAESAEMEELKNNVFENFFIIEDYYSEAFAEFGETYVPYNKKYPKGGYSEAQWIADQDKKLKELKRNKLEELKLMFLESQKKAK